MCGIFGYIGTRIDAPKLALAGLQLLEYRGYDSWGIAAKIENEELRVEKYIGKIAENQKNFRLSKQKSQIAIGHTRWATHGGVTEKNAHPHLDCTKQVAVLHNGIVENFAELKEELVNKGHTFISETDTEVITHLIEDQLKTEDFPSAVLKTFIMLKGMNAIVAVYAPTNSIIAAKSGSPLVIGKGKDGLYIASDVSGIIKHTRNILFLKDNEMAVLKKDVTLFSLPDGLPLKPAFEKIDWKIEDAEKGTYPHFMIKEIHEQPKVIQNIAKNYAEQADKLAEVIANAKGTFFIGAGTASYACISGVYLFSKIAGAHVNHASASEFNYLEDFINKKSLIIALSQSGETIDIVEPLNTVKKKKSTIVAIVNVLGSTIYRMADYKLLLGAGPEKAVASTKAYIAKLCILLLLAFSMKKKNTYITELLARTAGEVTRLLKKEQIAHIEKIADILKDKEHIYGIGRGVSYPSALEAAMKIKEVSYIHMEGLAGGELKHGSIALISPGTPCIVFAPNDETYEATISNAMEIKARGGIIIGVSHKKHFVFDHFIEVHDMQEASIIAQIIPMQLLAYFLAVKRGFDPDKPRNLAKSVTVK